MTVFFCRNGSKKYLAISLTSSQPRGSRTEPSAFPSSADNAAGLRKHRDAATYMRGSKKLGYGEQEQSWGVQLLALGLGLLLIRVSEVFGLWWNIVTVFGINVLTGCFRSVKVGLQICSVIFYPTRALWSMKRDSLTNLNSYRRTSWSKGEKVFQKRPKCQNWNFIFQKAC